MGNGSTFFPFTKSRSHMNEIQTSERAGLHHKESQSGEAVTNWTEMDIDGSKWAAPSNQMDINRHKWTQMDSNVEVWM